MKNLPFWIKSYPKGIPAEIEENVLKYKSVLDVFEEACEQFPNRPAFTNLEKTLTYSELNRKAESFAAFLQNQLKMKSGDRIALQLPNVLQYPVALYGSLKAGLVIVNTNPLYTEREMKHQFNDSGATAIVILANFAHNLEKVVAETKIRHVIVTEVGDLLDFPKRILVNAVLKYVKKMVPRYSLPEMIPMNVALSAGASMTYVRPEKNLDEIVFLQYTGGTTGVSKGAMLTHRNIISNMEQILVWIQSLLVPGAEVAICALPMYHVFAMTVHSLTLVKFGAHNILITNPRDIPGLVKSMRQYPFSITTGVNTLFNALLNNEAFHQLDFSKIKLSVAGGMALQPPIARKWKEVTKTLIVEGYGLTETSPLVCVNPVDGTDRIGTIGLPAPSTWVKMLTEDGQDAKLGEPGELCVKGPQVMKGYWQRPQETADVMTADGWFKSGDIAVMDQDGFCKIVDRKKDMILVSGFNVYPNEIEEVIAAHPGVLEVAAVGIADPHSGEVVKVFIVKKDPALSEAEVIEFARKNLTSYKVPKHVEFRTELPKTNVGKILRRMLKEPAAPSL